MLLLHVELTVNNISSVNLKFKNKVFGEIVAAYKTEINSQDK